MNNKDEYTHTTREGKKISLSEIEDSHLNNIINHLRNRAKEGILMRDGGGFDEDDIWYEEWTIYGKEVLELTGYKHYIKEQKRRAKLT